MAETMRLEDEVIKFAAWAGHMLPQDALAARRFAVFIQHATNEYRKQRLADLHLSTGGSA